MRKLKYILIILGVLVWGVACGQNDSINIATRGVGYSGDKPFLNKAKCVKRLFNHNDTLSIYIRQANCDTVVYTKHQIYKDSEGLYLIRYFEQIKVPTPKRCYDLENLNYAKTSFKTIRTQKYYDQILNDIAFVEELTATPETQIQKCLKNKFKITLTAGKKRTDYYAELCGNEFPSLVNMALMYKRDGLVRYIY